MMSAQVSALPIRKLRDLCASIEYGYTASAVPEQVGPRFLRITDIVPEVINWSTVPYCAIAPAKLSRYLLADGELVIARTGATTGYAKYLRRPPRAVFASYLVRLKLKSEADGVHGPYVGAVVQSDAYKRFIMKNIGGSAQPNANAQVLTSFPLRLPSLGTQRRIAAVLWAYDELIENNLRRIKILEDMAQLLFQEWFVEFRFPGHEKVRMVDSGHGSLPQGWERRRLGDAIVLNYGKALKEPDRRGGKVPVFGSSGIVGYHDAALVRGPGIIVGRKGNVGSVYWSDSDFFPIDTVYYVSSRVPLQYLYHDLQTKNFINSDAAVPGLSRRQAYSLDIVVPSEDALGLFCQLRDVFHAQTALLRRQVENLRSTRDLLLPKLVSGDIDVSTLDIDEPEAGP